MKRPGICRRTSDQRSTVMQKTRNTTFGNTTFRYVTLVLVMGLSIFILSGCAAKLNQIESTNEQPDPMTESAAPTNTYQEKVRKRIEAMSYDFTLTPAKENRPDEYTREEIESFLCSVVENYISSEEVFRFQVDDRYVIKAKNNAPNELEATMEQELNRWFEDKVTVTSQGNFTIIDVDLIKRFYAKVNELIGSEKFVYTPDQALANIIILLNPPEDGDAGYKYLGETTVLQDDMRTRIGINDSKISIDVFRSGIGTLEEITGGITFTDAEKEFRKENRLVKVRILNILDPGIRHYVLVHELFHTIGFTGHSPYHDSHLFPLPVKALNEEFSGLKLGGKVMTQMAERTIEMLYRPEMVPGMSVKEAAALLLNLKHLDKTPDSQINAFLLQKQTALEAEKKQLLADAKKNYDSRLDLYLLLERLERKEFDLLAELQEIKTFRKSSLLLIDQIKKSKTLLERLAIVRREIILLKNRQKTQTELLIGAAGKKRAAGKKHIKLCAEELVVLNDIIQVLNETADAEQRLKQTHSVSNRKEQEIRLRKIMRGLIFIKKKTAQLK